MSIRDWPIVRKLAVLLAFNTALAVLAIAVVFIVGSALSRHRDMEQQLHAMAQVIGENSRAAIAFNDPDGAQNVMNALQSQQEIASVALFDAQGQRFASVDFEAARSPSGATSPTVLPWLFPSSMTATHTMLDNGHPVGSLTLEAELHQIWSDLLQNLAWMMLIALALSAMAVRFGLRFHRILSGPVLNLAAVSHQVSAEQDYSLRAFKQGNDEVGTLVDDFNHMLAEIEARDEALRQERSSLEERVAQRTADLMLAMEEAERANKVKSEFLSTVSHELRTPLTAIAGSIGLISGGALGAMPPAIQTMLEIAHKNSQRLSFLINDLLDMEKLLAGKLHFDMVGQELMPLVEQALIDNQAYADQHGVTYTLTRRMDGVSVEVDAQRLQQVLANILSNAAKFSPAGATVEIAVGRSEDGVRVAIIDHGPGVPIDFQSRIFQKFSQADASDTRRKGGTGLGLAITRELVERMGGEVGFVSEPGQGATFYFDLPLWNPYLSRPLPLKESSEAMLRARVLVVEDDTDVADLLSMMLQDVGYGVDIVTSGAEALAYARRKSYAAMTLDLRLPDGDGIDVIRTLRAEPATRQLPIVVIAAKMEEGREALGIEDPGIEWLAKPIDRSRLILALEHLIAPEPRPTTRVLHVEDDLDLHRAVRGLAGEGYDFAQAGSLREARARVALQQFDVVLLDPGLPNETGWDLLPDIRRQQPQARVVVLSESELSPALTHGADAVLCKADVSAQALRRAIGPQLSPDSSPEGM